MRKKYTVFSTDIWEAQCSFDVEALYTNCQRHQRLCTGVQRSNRGGYQGHSFQDQEFIELILSNIPVISGKPLPKVQVQAWVNINGHMHWNTVHNHLDEGCLISGVFYVRCPPDSGDLYVYDPRFFGNAGTHYQYYRDESSNAGGYLQIEPRPNLLLFFPPSIMHMVGPNLSHEERCSIAFNILVEPGQKIL